MISIPIFIITAACYMIAHVWGASDAVQTTIGIVGVALGFLAMLVTD